MRYPEGGGLTAKERAQREQVRFAAAQMFTQGANDAQVAQRFHVTTMSANRWHRTFEHGGLDALASQGPGGATCKLDEVQLGALEAASDAGPAAHGYLDQCWTCARIAELIARKFGISYTARGVDYLLHRLGFQLASAHAAGRRTQRSSDHDLARTDLAGHKKTAADLDAWLCFEDESGQGLRPPKGRTWARRGVRPIVTVCAKGSGRVSVAGLIATKPGRTPRLIFRTHLYHGRKKEKKGFTEADYAALLDGAHQQLGGPIVLVWDNLNTHVSAQMTTLIAARSWLSVFQLPAYACELDPVEGVWAHLKKSLVNLVKHTVDELLGLVKTRLKRMQYRPGLIAGFLVKTGLDLRPP